MANGRRFFVVMDTPQEAQLWAGWLGRPLFVYDSLEFDLLT